jgi:hypothetical protein
MKITFVVDVVLPLLQSKSVNELPIWDLSLDTRPVKDTQYFYVFNIVRSDLSRLSVDCIIMLIIKF